MEFKGTKGVWKRVKLEKTDFYPERNEIHYGNAGECVAEFVGDDYDALLISKAPQMLGLLEDFVETASGVGVLNVEYYKNKFEQLIKSATEL